MRKIETWILDHLLPDDQSFKEFNPGDVIFRHGDPGDYMAVVMRGTVLIQRFDRPIAEVGAGSVFGEMALIDGQPRSADAIAKTSIRLAVIDERHFKSLVSRTPDFALSLMKILVERLRANLQS